MSYLNSKRLSRIDQLIRLKATGSPKEFAGKLEISERALYDHLSWLKSEGGCPIRYCRLRRSYYYARKGRFVFEFRRAGG